MAKTVIQDGMAIDWDVEIPMDDGIVLKADVFRPIKPGTRAVVWMPSVGLLNMTTHADGVTVIKKPGWREGIELPAGEAAVTYADLDAWLILSHLASVRIGALATDEDRIVGLMDPAILALVGTSPILLRRVPEDPERSGHLPLVVEQAVARGQRPQFRAILASIALIPGGTCPFAA